MKAIDSMKHFTNISSSQKIVLTDQVISMKPFYSPPQINYLLQFHKELGPRTTEQKRQERSTGNVII